MWNRERTFIIAEAGVNHNGSLEMAIQLVDAAAEAGADVVKFQTFRAERLVTGRARKAVYQQVNTGGDDGQLEMLRRLELAYDDHAALVRHCEVRGIRFMSTAFDEESLDFLATLPMPAVKVPSGDITAGPLLWRTARLRRPLILSTGMATLGDIEQALHVIAHAFLHDSAPTSWHEIEMAGWSDAGRAALLERVVVLHCTTEYPAPAQDVNLRAMDVIANAFGLPVGYSDHTAGIAVPLAAVARGACVIEKHFTLDCSLPGPDHVASLEPHEFKDMVQGIRTIEQALGTAAKRPVPSEQVTRAVARRSMVAAHAIGATEVLSAGSLVFKRPGNGVSPMRYWDVMGRKAGLDLQADDPLPW